MGHVDTIDIAQFGMYGPIVQFYLTHVDEVEALDLELGDKAAKGADFINSLKAEHPTAVEMAEQMIKDITAMEEPARSIVIFSLTRNREFTKIPTDYIAANQPKEEESNQQDAAVVAELWAKRSVAQKQALNMFKGLELAEIDPSLMALLPACPEGKKGVAPGQKRGQQGRRLPSPVNWTVVTVTDDGVVTEDHPGKTGAQIAKVVGVKSSDIRIAVEKKYADATPDEFEVTFGNKTLKGVKAGTTTTEDIDDSDEEPEVDNDLGEVNFDD